MRVAHLNMTDPSSQCSAGFRIETANNKRFCTRNTNNAGCCSMIIEQFGIKYTQVCGYVRGYQHGSTDAFGDFGSVNTIADGVSVQLVLLTYGHMLLDFKKQNENQVKIKNLTVLATVLANM